MVCAPCTAAFSAFQISSRSANSRPSSRDLLFEVFQALLGGLVGLLAEGLAFDLELDEAPFEPVQLFRFRVDLDADAARGLVHEVDGLVRQLSIGDVAVRQRGRGDDRGIGDLHAMVHLVALFQPAQDGDGVRDVGLIDQDLLKTPLERRVFFDVFTIFVERRRTHAVQLATRQRRLQHVAGIHRALGLARADHGMQLVDEEDDPALLLGQIVQDRLEPFLEFAAELGAGDERPHVEGEQPSVLQALRDLAVHDAERKPLDDGGLTDAGLADQDRVVLGAALQDLDGAADLVVASDDRIELALAGPCREIDGIFLERLAALLGVRVIDRLPAANGVDGIGDALLVGTRLAQDLAQLPAVFARGEQENLARDELILAFLGVFVAKVQELFEIARDVHLATRPFDARQATQRFVHPRAQSLDVDPGRTEQVARRAALLIQERRHDVQRLDELVIAPDGETLRVGERVLEHGGEFVEPHVVVSAMSKGRRIDAGRTGDSRPGASRPTPARDASRAPRRGWKAPPCRPYRPQRPAQLEVQYRLTTDRCTVAVQFLSFYGTPRRS